MKQTMSKQAWRDLWLEIAGIFDLRRVDRPSATESTAPCSGFCDYLEMLNHEDLACEVGTIGSICEMRMYWYDTESTAHDPVRAFTACFIAEIGEKAFMELAEVDDE